MKLSRKIFSFI